MGYLIAFLQRCLFPRELWLESGGWGVRKITKCLYVRFAFQQLYCYPSVFSLNRSLIFTNTWTYFEQAHIHTQIHKHTHTKSVAFKNVNYPLVFCILLSSLCSKNTSCIQQMSVFSAVEKNTVSLSDQIRFKRLYWVQTGVFEEQWPLQWQK